MSRTEYKELEKGDLVRSADAGVFSRLRVTQWRKHIKTVVSVRIRRSVLRAGVRVLSGLIVLALVLPLSPAQAEFAVGEAVKIVEAIKSAVSVDRSVTKPQAFSQSFDPTRQSASVKHIRLCPRKLVLFEGENYNLVPIPLDARERLSRALALSGQRKTRPSPASALLER